MRPWTSREHGFGAALVVTVAAAIAVPAWADSPGDEAPPRPGDDPGEGFVVPAGQPSDDPAGALPAAERAELDALGDCLRRHGGPLPEPRPEGALSLPVPRPGDDGALARATEACGLGEPPPGPHPFPLSDEEIADQRRALEEFVDCMEEHGQELGEPDVGPDRIAIPLGPGAFSEDFLAAQRDCGGPPHPPLP